MLLRQNWNKLACLVAYLVNIFVHIVKSVHLICNNMWFANNWTVEVEESGVVIFKCVIFIYVLSCIFLFLFVIFANIVFYIFVIFSLSAVGCKSANNFLFFLNSLIRS